jgi:lipopolysaccharide heptosyltransferase II
VLQSPNILAVRFSSIGDVLLTTPLLRAIRHRHPAARLTVLTKQTYAPLLSHNPNVSQLLAPTANHSLPRLAAELRSARYTHLLDLHDSARTRALRILVPGRWSTYPKHRLARAALIHGKRNFYRDIRPVAERYFDAARHLDVVPDAEPPDFFLAPEAEREVAQWFGGGTLLPDRPTVAIAPGAAHATKRWPVEHWRQLVQQVATRGLQVVIVGSADDAAVAAAIAQGSGSGLANVAGRFGLQGTGALLRRSAAVVSGDTGVMHMATAVGTPVIALFGPTVRAFGFFPYSDRAQVLELGMSCRPCSSKGGPRCPLGHHLCLRNIGPEAVYQALSRTLT